MKKLSLLFAFVAVAIASQAGGNNDEESKITYPMPQKVKAVMESKCFECHNDAGRSDKAKKGLNFSTLDGFTNIEKIATLSEVKKEVSEGEMPPQKFLEKHPEAALTPDETKLLVDWVQKESKALLKKK
ncbi:heme-binding domain-containing protein [Mangrovibacterium diazotrophicum]|uniref:Heme-binding protein n=1 Tax=Mangrovibacterium diazotrophicum TaxID=1261403 RepID=A0A419W3V7_9BACT|nr:heme-binding domain-containing protein [Mangrovibacterium diazotrophicum]RKD90142.1 heme-binding protein [Mangrovibacterium diazotrophicum]